MAAFDRAVNVALGLAVVGLAGYVVWLRLGGGPSSGGLAQAPALVAADIPKQTAGIEASVPPNPTATPVLTDATPPGTGAAPAGGSRLPEPPSAASPSGPSPAPAISPALAEPPRPPAENGSECPRTMGSAPAERPEAPPAPASLRSFPRPIESLRDLPSVLPADRIVRHEVQPRETLEQFARRYHVTVGLIQRVNGLEDADVLRVGQCILIPRGPFRAVIDKEAFTLTILLDDHVVKVYAIGVGRDGTTPAGEFKVLSRVEDPEWTSPEGQFFEPSDPANPLGTRWIGIGEGYGIHGTNDSSSIGRASTRGCIRLDNAAVEEVYDFLGPESRVTIK